MKEEHKLYRLKTNWSEYLPNGGYRTIPKGTVREKLWWHFSVTKEYFESKHYNFECIGSIEEIKTKYTNHLISRINKKSKPLHFVNFVIRYFSKFI